MIPKDFALSTNDMDGKTNKVDNKTPKIATEQNYTSPKRQSFSFKIGRTLRNSIAKIVPSSGGSLGTIGKPLEEQKKRSGSTGYLEYPELEILPQHGVYKELEALEKTINHIRRPSLAVEAIPRCFSGTSSRAPLSLRFAEQVSDFQLENRKGSPDTVEFLSATEVLQPNTPVGQRVLSKAISTHSQQFGTPNTHISYEDCVPKHMLDDNNSAKSDTTVLVKRSKSTVEHNISSLPHKYNTWGGRAKSVSIKRMRACGSELEKMLSAEKETRRQNDIMLNVKPHNH